MISEVILVSRYENEVKLSTCFLGNTCLRAWTLLSMIRLIHMCEEVGRCLACERKEITD